MALSRIIFQKPFTICIPTIVNISVWSVNQFLKLGDHVEGRDNRAVQKTVLGFMKLLFPTGEPTPEEFDEIVEYALEVRRRVKEQLNKRKPDEEYTCINMSYVNCRGEKVVVYYPESKYSEATQTPRKSADVEILRENAETDDFLLSGGLSGITEKSVPARDNKWREKTLNILYGDTGYNYEVLFVGYMENVQVIESQEPYLVYSYQMNNLVRFAEIVAKTGDCKQFKLTTKTGETIEEKRIQESLEQLKAVLAEYAVDFEYTFSELIPDRFIHLSNGWEITLGRGLHIYQNQGRNYFLMGTYDQALKPCLECKIDYKRMKYRQNLS